MRYCEILRIWSQPTPSSGDPGNYPDPFSSLFLLLQRFHFIRNTQMPSNWIRRVRCIKLERVRPRIPNATLDAANGFGQRGK
jgi:hypothetical protein